MAEERFEGELVGFTYAAEDGSFAVARVRGPDRREAIVVGPLGHIIEGQHLAVTGRWAAHPQFGRQFKADKVLVEDPRTLRGLERYLSSGAVKGLGPEFARRLVDHFKLDTLRVIEESPERLSEVAGIGKKRIEQIVAHWEKDQAGREVMATLRGYGVGQALANRIVERFGRKAMGILTKEPYRLAAEIKGVGFRTADRIARENGISMDDPARAEAALIYLLNEAEGEGHTFLPLRELLLRATKLEIPAERAQEALVAQRRQGRLVVHEIGGPGDQPVYTPELERAESNVAMRLREVLEAGRSVTVDPGPAEKAVGLVLNEDQRRAITLAFTAGVTVITGGPGTGKTTLVKVLLRAAQLRNETWVLAAPTGRAARRLAESTGAEARTLHRTLEYNPRNRLFTRDARNPLEAQGVLIDEASMVDIHLMEALLAAIPDGCRLICVGDADQLPSVGPGRVLAELVSCGEVPVATLAQVYRQAAESGIVRNAWRINRGELPQSGEKEPPVPGREPDFFILPREVAQAAQDTLVKIVTERLPKNGFDPMADVQVLTPMHSGLLGTEALNERLQKALNPDGAPFTGGSRPLRVGDRVIQVRNDYDAEVMNGEVGRITALEERGVVVDFEGKVVTLTGEATRDLELAYAISIHKSQGSEYPAVVVALSRAHRMMLRRNLLYTAITRARRFCCVVGEAEAIATAVATQGGADRFTRLADRLLAGARDAR